MVNPRGSEGREIQYQYPLYNNNKPFIALYLISLYIETISNLFDPFYKVLSLYKYTHIRDIEVWEGLDIEVWRV